MNALGEKNRFRKKGANVDREKMLDYIQTKFSSKQIHKWKLHKIALDHQEMAMDRRTPPPPPPSTSMNREKLPTEIDSSYTYVYHIL